ncbi:MAG: hypothetical protein AB8F94_08030 [Saprospiraceae bacterium]
MKKLIKNILLFILPFLIMILINESVRPTIEEKPYKLKGVQTMNSNIVSKNKCSWNCYIDTNYCKKYHVKTVSNYFEYIDPIYEGIIRSLHSTGSYGLANVIFLVLLLPFLMFLLFVKILDLQSQINSLKSKS